MRLIDGNELYGIEKLLDTDIIQSSKESNWLMSQILHDINAMPTIDPETLPIVQELRVELERVTAERDESRRDCAVAESNHSECLAQLTKARVQLKSAVTDMEALMWHSGDGCNICVEVHREPYVHLDCDLGSGCECNPEWRGVAP